MAYNRWLEHYQRKGAHWGERNGPPYPLSRQERFSSDGKQLTDKKYLSVTTSNFVKKSSGGNVSKVQNGKRWMFNKVDGDYDSRPKTKAVSSRSVKDYVNIKNIQIYDHLVSSKKLNGKNILANAKILGFNVARFLDKTNNGLPVKSRELTPEQDAKAVNPSHITKTVAGSNNCLLCTVAYDMRRRGYDVMAKQSAPIEYLYDIDDPDFKYLYKGTKVERSSSLDALSEKLRRQKNSRGAMLARWNGSKSGHCVAYEVKNGRLTLYDAQDGARYDNPKELFNDSYDFRAVRLDKLEPDYNLIRLAIE